MRRADGPILTPAARTVVASMPASAVISVKIQKAHPSLNPDIRSLYNHNAIGYHSSNCLSVSGQLPSDLVVLPNGPDHVALFIGELSQSVLVSVHELAVVEVSPDHRRPVPVG